MRVKAVAPDADIVSEGEYSSQSCLLVDGFVCRYATVGSGGRQIMSFHTPGDIPDLQSLHLKRMDHGLMALVPSTVAFIQHGDLRRLCLSYPGVAALLWRDTLVDAAIFRAWIVNVGRRDARTRMAHLLCELAVRFDAVGLSTGHSYRLPARQTDLADALGLSTVHVNRVLMELRAERLIKLEARNVTILDWDGLQRAGEFDALYLHVDPNEDPG
jgi:CRP-like cAMP-binding protein